jgi:hypothetical protein
MHFLISKTAIFKGHSNPTMSYDHFSRFEARVHVEGGGHFLKRGHIIARLEKLYNNGKIKTFCM